jgi:hypothetical protein
MKQRHDLFIGFKANRAIPVHNIPTRDFLIQATLDADVHRIEYQSRLTVDERILLVDGIIVERFDGRYAVDIVDGRRPHDLVAEALTHLAFAHRCHGIIALSAADLRVEPRCTAAREVWSHRAVRIHADDRTEILESLESGGPVGLAQLASSVCTRGDARAVIYALACDGAVELDLRNGLGADTAVRAGNLGSALHSYGT